jgi:hypothetical protein
MENGADLAAKYAAEMEIDTDIDAINLKDKQYSSPRVKHKWLYRLMQCKRNLYTLMDAKEQLVNQKLADNPLNLSKKTLSTKAESDSDIRMLSKEIREYELLVDYLDASVNKILSQMGFDFKNLVELIKMEQL